MISNHSPLDNSCHLSFPDDEQRLSDWFDFDQAAAPDDLSSPLDSSSISQNHLFNSNNFLFQLSKPTSPSTSSPQLHFNLLQNHQPFDLQPNNHSSPPSLDPSTILPYPDLSPLINSNPLHPTPSPLIVPSSSHPSSLISLPPLNHSALLAPLSSSTPSYPLDPLLLSASIPSRSTSLPPPPPQPHPPPPKQEDASMASPSPSPSADHASSHRRTPSHPHPLVDVPDWADKPSAEEYKLLSSKEKRQLRNKISARNFRHRRKEHISALEQQVAARDETIECLCRDLSAARLENKDLRSEVETLKQKWSDLMRKIDEIAPPPVAPSSSSPPPASPRLRSAKTGTTLLAMPNLHKDLGSHSRKPFNGVGGMAGGNVGVHTTLIPEISIDVYQEPGAGLSDTLSPQARIELKHISANAPLVQPAPAKTAQVALKKLSSTEQVGQALSQMVFDALKGSPDASSVDQDKLLGCLEGRLEIVVQDRAPPPYEYSDAVEQLRVQIGGLGV